MKRFLIVLKILFLFILLVALPLAVIYLCVSVELPFSVEETLSVVSLGVAIYSLEMSVVIALLIYWLQMRDSQKEEKSRKEKARCMMYSELETALEGAYMRAAGEGSISTGVSTKDILNTYLVELQDILKPEQFRLLISIVNKIEVETNGAMDNDDRAVIARDELLCFFHPWFARIMRSSYAKYFVCVKDYHDTLNKPIYNLLQTLAGATEPYQDRNEIYDLNGNILFFHKGNMEYQIYDGNGNRILDGTLELNVYDEYTIYEGYECSERYDGYYKNGKYSGNGILYSYKHEILKEGIWDDGKLVKGMEYNCLYKIEDDGWEFQENHREGLERYYTVNEYMDEEEMKDYIVVDDCIEGEYVEHKNVRTLKEFFESTHREVS